MKCIFFVPLTLVPSTPLPRRTNFSTADLCHTVRIFGLGFHSKSKYSMLTPVSGSMTELEHGNQLGVTACAIVSSLEIRALREMWRNPFRTWDIMVGTSFCRCNLVLGWFLAPWADPLEYIGSCQGSGLGGGSTLGNLDTCSLLLFVTLRSGFCPDLQGVSTLGTCCACPTDSGATGSAGAYVGVACLKMSARVLSAVVLSLPRFSNRAAGAEFWRASKRSTAAAVALLGGSRPLRRSPKSGASRPI